MLRHTLRSLRDNATRLVLSSLAIVLGVGFVTGTLIFSDGLSAATEERAGRLDRMVDVELTRDTDVEPADNDEVLPAALVVTVAAVAALVASVLPAGRALRQPVVASLAAE